MRTAILTFLVGCSFLAALARAGAAEDAAEQEVAREIGAVLAWRLGPETVEEKCRNLDAGGADIRKLALKDWLDKHAALIASVDSRVAEVVPLLYSPPPNVDAVQAIRKQVKELLVESIFEQKTPEESAALCKVEADPASPRWNNPGMPHVQQAMATLIDWQTSQKKK
jgi:hypothetical protein